MQSFIPIYSLNYYQSFTQSPYATVLKFENRGQICGLLCYTAFHFLFIRIPIRVIKAEAILPGDQSHTQKQKLKNNTKIAPKIHYIASNITLVTIL